MMTDRKAGTRSDEGNPRYECSVCKCVFLNDAAWEARRRKICHEGNWLHKKVAKPERRVQDGRRELKDRIGERHIHNIVWNSGGGRLNPVDDIKARLKDRRGPDRRKPLARG